jgi:IS5 family transposase
MRCFKRYVQLILPMQFLGTNLSYSRWATWRRELCALVEALAQRLCWKAGYSGTSHVDSTSLSICGIQRERDNKCFARTARKAKSSLGWFVGFKLHLLSSDRGGLLRFWFTPANVHDVKALDHEGFIDAVSSTLIRDNAYRGGARQEALAARGLGLLVCLRKKDRRMLPKGLGALLHTRWRIETVIGQLKARCGLGHLGSCRSPNALKTLVFSAVLLYTLNWENASA